MIEKIYKSKYMTICEYCKGKREFAKNCPSAYIYKNTLFIGANGYSKVNNVRIRYCPMCGQRLEATEVQAPKTP